MLLAQKAYVEGGLALELFCARLVDERRTGSPADRAQAETLLGVLTPVAKSWPSEWCLEANNLAIQVHGGYGYTRDFPVEQLWRDNRLNMIHEGTHGIHGIDLLGRKVLMDDGAGFSLLGERIADTLRIAREIPQFVAFATALETALSDLRESTRAAWSTGEPDAALANATPYLQAFGHVVLGWIWLDIAIAAQRVRDTRGLGDDDGYLRGKLQAARYFFEYELPRISAWLGVVSTRNGTCREMQEEWFAQ